MDKQIITVIGKDRAGIIAMVSTALAELDCNIENANQMILQHQFAGFFIVVPPPGLDPAGLSTALKEKTLDTGLTIHVNGVEETSRTREREEDETNGEGETFLVTTIGPDQKGLVAGFSSIIARFDANIENLKAVFKGGKDPNANIMSYQVLITPKINIAELFKALRKEADRLNLDIRIQHKNIFDAINKI